MKPCIFPLCKHKSRADLKIAEFQNCFRDFWRLKLFPEFRIWLGKYLIKFIKKKQIAQTFLWHIILTFSKIEIWLRISNNKKNDVTSSSCGCSVTYKKRQNVAEIDKFCLYLFFSRSGIYFPLVCSI